MLIFKEFLHNSHNLKQNIQKIKSMGCEVKGKFKVLCHSEMHLEITDKSTPQNFLTISKWKSTSYNQTAQQCQNEYG